MSMFSSYTRNFLKKTRESILLPRPDSDDDDDDPPTSLFYSAGTLPRQETIPLSDSRAFYHDQPGLQTSVYGFAKDDDSIEEQGEDSNLPYSDYSYSSRNAGMDLSEDTHSSSQQVPSGIYLDVPPPVSTPSYPSKNSLRESLLPTNTMIPQGITTVRPKRKFKDLAFAILYLGSLLTFFIIGIVLLSTTNSHILERYSKKTLFSAIRDSSGMLASIIALSITLGAIWIVVLRRFVRILAWGTIIAGPFVTLIMFIWTLAESGSSSASGGRDVTLTVASFIPLVIGSIYAKLIYSQRKRVDKTVQVIELACDILGANPEMFIVSLALMGAFLLFTIIWLVLFSRLWLVGHGSDGLRWVVDGNSYYLATFFVLIYLWTAALLSNIQRFTLAGVTAQWYFHHNDPASQLKGSATKAALIRGITTSLGTISFGALILSIVQTLQIVVRYTRKRMKRDRGSTIFVILTNCLYFIDGIVEQVNNYTIVFAGITGESFCSSALSATKIFRRNLITGLLTDLITKMILYIGSIVVALFSGFGAWIFATHSLGSPYGFVIGTLATFIPLYISQFYTHMVMNIVDATFMCYAIDLDTNTIHNNRAHKAFNDSD